MIYIHSLALAYGCGFQEVEVCQQESVLGMLWVGGFSGGVFRSPTADRMVLTSSRNQRAQITIVNVGNDSDVTAAIGLVQSSLDEMGINALVVEETDQNCVGWHQARGINATYLFGESNISQSYTENGVSGNRQVAGKDYTPMYNLAKRLEGRESGDPSSMTNKIEGYSTYSEKPELTSGWEYDGTSMITDTWKQQINIGFVNTYYAQGFIDTHLPTTKIKRKDFLAITILHMMGHTAGLDHTDDKQAYSIMSGGNYLKAYLNAAGNYKTAVHGNSLGHTIWRMFVQSYFSPIWNGNPNAGLSKYSNSPWSNMGILPFAIRKGYVKN